MSFDLNPEGASYCRKLVQDNAPDMYLANLLLPTTIRDAVFVLHAFHIEVTNAVLSAREPMAGEIRLQWWADVVAGKREEEARGHPTAAALLDLLASEKVPRQALDAKLQAHVFDLYNDPMGDRTMFEGYCGETRSVLFQLAAGLCDIETDTNVAAASGHSGVATGIASVLQNLPRSRAEGKLFIPKDLLAAVGLSPEAYFAAETAAHTALLEGLIDYGFDHHRRAVDAVRTLPKGFRTVFKPLALVPLYLGQAAKRPERVLSGVALPSQLRRQWALWRG